MKRVLLLVGIAFALVIIVLGVLPFLVPSSVYKSRIEQAASQALGREVSVSGDLHISLLPVVSASVEDVTVANPEGFDEPYMIEAGALRGSVHIWPLVSQRVEVSQLSFEDAFIHLIRQENGAVNWRLGPRGDETSERDGADDTPFSTSIDRASLRNASVIFDDLETGQRFELTKLDAEASLKNASRPMTLRASGVFQGEPFDFNATVTSPQSYLSNQTASVDIKLGSNLGNLGFEGNVQTARQVELAGRFQANLPAMSALSDFAGLTLPVDLTPLGGLQATGNIQGPLTGPDLSFDEFILSGDGLNATFDGDVSIGDMPSIDGNLNLSVRDAYALSDKLGLPLNQLHPFKQISLTTGISGPVNELSFEGIEARTSSPVLVATYAGDLSFAGEGNLDGNLSADSPQLRTLLEQLGIYFPEGQGMRVASISGRTDGTLAAPAIRNGSFRLDDTKASGDLSADLRRDTPRLMADLQMPLLDLTPFIGQEKSQAKTKGWSAAPLELDALDFLDADLTLEADRIKLPAVTLEAARLQATLSGGRLETTLDHFSAFGGDWKGAALIDGSAQTPAIRFSMSSQGVQADQILGQLADFDRLTGIGQLEIDIVSEGETIRQIMQALDGTLSLDVADGALKGVNFSGLVRSASSLQELISSGTVNIRTLENTVPSQAETDFTTFETSLDLQEGIGTITTMALKNPSLEVSGTGQIDLGARLLDVRLTPAIDRTAQGNTSAIQLNGIPIPLRITGSWSSPQFSPDISGLQKVISQSATEKLRERLGGELGAVLSDRTKRDASPATEEKDDTYDSNPAEEDSYTGDEEADEDPAQKALRDTLDAILNPD